MVRGFNTYFYKVDERRGQSITEYFMLKTAAQISYAEKLKDYRWRQKSQAIMERDNHRCRKCYPYEWYSEEEEYEIEEVKNTDLEVHHMKYVGKNPWDTPDCFLITLCEGHHEDAHALLRNGRTEEFVMDWCTGGDLDKYGHFEGTIGELIALINKGNG